MRGDERGGGRERKGGRKQEKEPSCLHAVFGVVRKSAKQSEINWINTDSLFPFSPLGHVPAGGVLVWEEPGVVETLSVCPRFLFALGNHWNLKFFGH